MALVAVFLQQRKNRPLKEFNSIVSLTTLHRPRARHNQPKGQQSQPASRNCRRLGGHANESNGGNWFLWQEIDSRELGQLPSRLRNLRRAAESTNQRMQRYWLGNLTTPLFNANDSWQFRRHESHYPACPSAAQFRLWTAEIP